MRLQTPVSRARDNNIVTIANRHMAIVAVQLGASFVNKQQLITIGIARQAGHVAIQTPGAHFTMRIKQQVWHGPGRCRIISAYVVEIEQTGP